MDIGCVVEDNVRDAILVDDGGDGGFDLVQGLVMVELGGVDAGDVGQGTIGLGSARGSDDAVAFAGDDLCEFQAEAGGGSCDEPGSGGRHFGEWCLLSGLEYEKVNEGLECLFCSEL